MSVPPGKSIPEEGGPNLVVWDPRSYQQVKECALDFLHERFLARISRPLS